MSYLGARVGRCEVVHAMVLIDQTHAQCAKEHSCKVGCVCPMAAHFANDKAARRAPQSFAG